MNELKNDRLLRALMREPVDRTPVWIMRQAGRYLPEYRATRAKAGSFLGLATNPELACEVTLQPLARYPLDAAILFSDILMIPKAMGVGLSFAEGEGPRIERPVRSAADVAALPLPMLDEHQFPRRLQRLRRHANHVIQPVRMLRRRPLRRRNRRHRLNALALARHHQTQAIIAKRLGPVRMPDHARERLHIGRKPRFTIV